MPATFNPMRWVTTSVLARFASDRSHDAWGLYFRECTGTGSAGMANGIFNQRKPLTPGLLNLMTRGLPPDDRVLVAQRTFEGCGVIVTRAPDEDGPVADMSREIHNLTRRLGLLADAHLEATDEAGPGGSTVTHEEAEQLCEQLETLQRAVTRLLHSAPRPQGRQRPL